MAAQYNQVMTTILDDMVPLKKTTYRVRQSDPWYDDECRSAKRWAMKLERRYKRTEKTSKQSPSVSTSELQRRRFWRAEADNSTNPSRLWQTIDAVVGRGQENNPTSLTPEDFSAFFTSKVENVRRRTQCAPPSQYREVDVNVVNFSAFNTVTVAEIMKLIQEAPNKQSWLDPIPTWLLKECSDVLSPFLAALCNT